MTNELGKYIHELRGANSLRDFAKQCDLSHTHIDSIEKGIDYRTGKPVSISIDVLAKIYRGSGADLTHLIKIIAHQVIGTEETIPSAVSEISEGAALLQRIDRLDVDERKIVTDLISFIEESRKWKKETVTPTTKHQNIK